MRTGTQFAPSGAVVCRLTAPFLAAACVVPASGCSTFLVRESSLVPAATPLPPPSFDSAADLFVGDSTVAFLSEPETAPNENVGLWIPRTQLDGSIAVRFAENQGMRFFYRRGLSAGAMRAAPTTLGNPGHDTQTWGAGLMLRVPTSSPAWDLRLTLDAGMVEVPTHIEATCASRCSSSRPAAPIEDYGHPWVALLSLGLAVHYRANGDVGLWGGVVTQTHPTNTAQLTSTTIDANVRSGPLNPIVVLGADLHLGSHVSIVPEVSLPVLAAPVRYGPIVSVGLRGSFGPSPGHRRRSED